MEHPRQLPPTPSLEAFQWGPIPPLNAPTQTRRTTLVWYTSEGFVQKVIYDV